MGEFPRNSYNSEQATNTVRNWSYSIINESVVEGIVRLYVYNVKYQFEWLFCLLLNISIMPALKPNVATRDHWCVQVTQIPTFSCTMHEFNHV